MRAGARGRLLLRLVEAAGDAPPVLLAANTGAPLDADGARALAALRASGKRREPAAGQDGNHGTGHDATAGAGESAVVGRFGVGFTAVLGVADAAAVHTAAGGVAFDRVRARRWLLDQLGPGDEALAAEVRRRGASLPVLRTPFAVDPADGPAGEDVRALLEDGWTTVVALPLRPGATDVVRRQLAGAGDLLLLALPGLAEVVVELPGAPRRRVADVDERWLVLRRSGVHPPEALADRPAEEQLEPAWALAWALPRVSGSDGGDVRAAPQGDLPGVVLAPTPTEEPLPWPAVLVASLPLEPTRRHVHPGPAADAVLAAAGDAYADLLGLVAAERQDGEDTWPDPLDLVPTSPAAGWCEQVLQRRLAGRLPHVPLLTPAAPRPGAAALLPGERAVALEETGAPLDDAVLASLASAEPALVPAPRRHRAALEALGVQRVDLADLVEGWPVPPPGLHGPELWRDVLAALAPLALDQRSREALAGLPVPLADGRWLRGPRGTLLAPDGLDVPGEVAALLGRQGLRLVDAEAAGPADGPAAVLLERLGAVPAGARALLDAEATREAVLALAEALAEEDPTVVGLGVGPDDLEALDALDTLAQDVADAVLAWLDAELADDPDARGSTSTEAPVGVLPGARAWLLDLPLPDEEGEPAPAGTLVLPGSPAERLLTSDVDGAVTPCDPDLVERWGPAVLVAAGVTASASALVWAEVDLDDPPAELEDAAGAWLDEVVPGDGWTASDVVWVRDVDLAAEDGARPERAAELVRRASASPVVLRALTAPVVLTGPAGEVRRVRGPVAQALGALLTGPVAAPDAPASLAAVLPPAPAWLADLDPWLRRAAGAVQAWADLDVDGWEQVLGGAGPVPAAAAVLEAWAALAARLEEASAPGDPGGDLLRDGLALDAVLALDDDGSVTRCAPEEVAVVDDPLLAALPGLGPLVVVPAGAAGAVADALDLDLARERLDGVVTGAGAPEEPPVAVRTLLLAAGAPADEVPRVCHGDGLAVDGVTVEAWVERDAEGRLLAHGSSARGVARALAWSTGCWASRDALERALADQAGVGRAALADVAVARSRV